MIQKVSGDIEKNVCQQKRYILSKFLCSSLIFISFLLFFSSLWYIRTYGGIGFDSILFTLFSNLKGVEPEILVSFMFEAATPAILISAIIVMILFLKNENRRFMRIKNVWSVITSVLLAVVLLASAGQVADFFAYVYKLTHQTKIFEEKYVEPSLNNIRFPRKERNLIYIFLESLETTFLPDEKGGVQEENIMPEFISLAENNLNFSHNNGIGGFLTPTGSTWTVAAMVAQSSGVPLKASSGPLENNEYGKEYFLPGVTTITDILCGNGYNTVLLVGSEASFANRDVFYRSHSVEKIYDLHDARKDGIVSDDYYVWWGMEDKHLFTYAKDKLMEMSAESKPFALTMLTADTHFEAGYVCDLCENEYEEQYNNVVACASHQIGEFIDWIKSQDFYENTTIVLVGDHLTMDNNYIKRNVDADYERRVYNCIINSAIGTENTKNRVFTSFDLFPTTLAAMGCEIEGERLGLGTNLFSNTPTLAEEMGYDDFNRQISMSSSYYIKNFMVK